MVKDMKFNLAVCLVALEMMFDSSIQVAVPSAKCHICNIESGKKILVTIFAIVDIK